MNAIKPLLSLGAYTFSAMTRARRWLYEKKVLTSYQLPQPVISVGNLTWGGTGKTPVIDALLGQLEPRNLKVCVLTRGYGRKSRKTFVVDGNSKVADVGEEPQWLFMKHPSSMILVSDDRAKAALEKTKDI